jgi:hypothetical protein
MWGCGLRSCNSGKVSVKGSYKRGNQPSEKMANALTSWAMISFSRRTLIHWVNHKNTLQFVDLWNFEILLWFRTIHVIICDYLLVLQYCTAVSRLSQVVTLLTYILEVLCSNFGLDTEYPWVFLSPSRQIPGEYRNSIWKLPSTSFSSHHSLITIPIDAM